MNTFSAKFPKFPKTIYMNTYIYKQFFLWWGFVCRLTIKSLIFLGICCAKRSFRPVVKKILCPSSSSSSSSSLFSVKGVVPIYGISVFITENTENCVLNRSQRVLNCFVSFWVFWKWKEEDLNFSEHLKNFELNKNSLRTIKRRMSIQIITFDIYIRLRIPTYLSLLQPPEWVPVAPKWFRGKKRKL